MNASLSGGVLTFDLFRFFMTDIIGVLLALVVPGVLYAMPFLLVLTGSSIKRSVMLSWSLVIVYYCMINAISLFFEISSNPDSEGSLEVYLLRLLPGFVVLVLIAWIPALISGGLALGIRSLLKNE